MPSVKGTQTEKNLLTAFAGESQARNRYNYFASQAKKEGFVQIQNAFEETANQEKEHAKRLFKQLEGGDVEIAAAPDPAFVAELMAALSDFLTSFEPGTTVAFCLTRPGIGGVSTIDRRWASLITDCATDFEVPVEPFFRANDEALVQVAA